jgi:hypothetical protein
MRGRAGAGTLARRVSLSSLRSRPLLRVLHVGAHKTFQCQACRAQTSLIAGTLFQSTHLALTLWFLAIYLISQAKTGRSALALTRQLGVSYPTPPG